jgi:hypothetical protein
VYAICVCETDVRPKLKPDILRWQVPDVVSIDLVNCKLVSFLLFPLLRFASQVPKPMRMEWRVRNASQ